MSFYNLNSSENCKKKLIHLCIILGQITNIFRGKWHCRLSIGKKLQTLYWHFCCCTYITKAKQILVFLLLRFRFCGWLRCRACLQPAALAWLPLVVLAFVPCLMSSSAAAASGK
jgi:hypothetical protein